MLSDGWRQKCLVNINFFKYINGLNFLTLFKKSQNKLIISCLIFLAAVFEFLGLGLIYPLVSLLFDLGNQNNDFITSLKNLIEKIGLPYSRNSLIVYIIILIVSKSFVLLIHKYFCAKSSMTFMNEIRKEVYTKMTMSNFGIVSDKKSKLINAMTTQSAIAGGALDLLYRLIQTFFIMIALILLGISISNKIFLLAIFLGLIIGYFLNISIKYSKNLGINLANFNEKLFNNVSQSLNNYRYLKSVEKFDYYYDGLRPVLSNIFKTQLKFTLINRGTQIITEPLVVTLLMLVLFAGLTFFGESTSSLFIIYLILARFFSSIIGFLRDLQSYNKDIVSVKYCYNLIENTLVKNSEKIGSNKFNGLKKMISLRKVCFSFQSDKIFENLDIDFKKNEITVICGKSGNGKSTLLNLILGLYIPIKGKVYFDSMDSKNLNFISLRNRVGMVTQDSAIFNMSIKENLSFKNSNATDSEIKTYINDFGLLNIFPNNIIDLNYYVDESSSNLSGGEKQRLAIIRELLAEPEILILDEVTSALDGKTMDKIINYIKTLRGKSTIIIVTHQLEYLSIADSAYEIKNGMAIKINTNKVLKN